MIKICYQIGRLCEKYVLTGVLGKVYEDDEKITCVVKKSLIDNSVGFKRIFCKNIKEEEKKIAEYYNLNKPIRYIIENITFGDIVHIYGDSNTEIIINNCSFDLGVTISTEGKCTINNTNIGMFSKNNIYSKDLTIDNIKCKAYETPCKIVINVPDKLDINKTDIKDNNIQLIINDNKHLNINNSHISCKNIDCQSKHIDMSSDSTLSATEKVKINTDDYNQLIIDSKTIDLNGKELNNEKGRITLRKITDTLTSQRLELIQLLNALKNNYKRTYNKKMPKNFPINHIDYGKYKTPVFDDERFLADILKGAVLDEGESDLGSSIFRSFSSENIEVYFDKKTREELIVHRYPYYNFICSERFPIDDSYSIKYYINNEEVSINDVENPLEYLKKKNSRKV